MNADAHLNGQADFGEEVNFNQLWTGLETELPDKLAAYRLRIAELEVHQKMDQTLLTEADVAIENLIIDMIRSSDPEAKIVAEESGTGTWRPGSDEEPDRIWVIDPIDGTAEFVRQQSVEFCSVVCLLEQRNPTVALVVAPELGVGRTPIIIRASLADKTITVNGAGATYTSSLEPALAASMTRSSSSPAPAHERTMSDAGYTLKTQTTSQTLDMVRTAVDLSAMVDQPTRFDLFYRPKQKIWDGLAGLCLGEIAGLMSTDLNAQRRLPVTLETLSLPEPTFASTVMGRPEAVTWFTNLARDSRIQTPRSS